MSDWHIEDIKAAVRKRGHTLAGLGAKIGISRQCMTRTMTWPAARNERVIAKAIGEAPSVIWPSRFHPDGRRKRPQPAENYLKSRRISKRAS